MSLGFSHESPIMKNDEWLTPPEIIRACGDFDLDPCAPINRPWPMAKKHFTIEDNGFLQPWEGRVWLNPPYGDQCWKWLDRLSQHKNGVALIFARTGTLGFYDSVWCKAKGLLFLRGRVRFYNNKGIRAKNSPGAYSVLVAYDNENSIQLMLAQKILGGKYIML